jgi:LysR family transcriptional regulator, low CO2-responsive transcriptional regulator
MHVTLHQLKVFQTVAESQSFTRAAEVLHLTQPAVSIQVKQLEDNVGLPLLEVVGKKIYLTQAGEELLRYSRGINRSLNEATQVLDELKGMQRGRLTIAVASTANYFAPRLLATFNCRFEHVKVSLDVTNREGLLRHLETNDVDIVIMGRPPDNLDLAAEAFMDNPLVVIAPPSHPLTATQHINVLDLQSQTFLIREQGSGTRIAMERCFREKNMTLSTGMEMNSNEAIKQAVQAGLGLGIVSRHTIELELETQRLVVLDVDSFPIVRHWYIVHRRGKRLSKIATAFREFVLSEALALVDKN